MGHATTTTTTERDDPGAGALKEASRRRAELLVCWVAIVLSSRLLVDLAEHVPDGLGHLRWVSLLVDAGLVTALWAAYAHVRRT